MTKGAGDGLDVNDIARSHGVGAVRDGFDGAVVVRLEKRPLKIYFNRFTPISLDDIQPEDDPIYLVEGILPAGPSFGETPAPPKSLKSFFLMDIFLHVAIGKTYGGRQVQQGTVVYITSEGIKGVKRRLIAMRRHHGVECKRVPFLLVPVMPNLGTGTADLEELIAAITLVTKDLGTPLRAIAIDTLRKATPGKSENDSKDMSVFLANCEALARHFNCHVNAVHHSPRSDDSRGSGTNAVEGSCDVILPVMRCDKADGTPRATVTVARMKDGEEGDQWSFEVHKVEIGVDRNGTPIFGGYVVLADEPAKRSERADKTNVVALTPAAKIALEALAEALLEKGTPAPASTYIPASVKTVVSTEDWREFAYRRGISDGELRARQKAFKTAGEQLQARHRIGCWDNNVWIVPLSKEG
jgi:hypothetical protein